MFLFNRPTWSLSRQQAADLVKFLRVRDLPSVQDVLLRVLLAVAVTGPVIFLVWLLAAEPVGALPTASGSTALLAGLLGAQAAISALTLAVTVFVMQGVSARGDADDRVYAEYVRRSWVRPIFWCSVGAVGVTGAVLAVETLVGDTGAIAQGVPGIPNLALVAVFALAVNLTAGVALFEKAIRLTQPVRWRNLRSDVNKRDVREAVSVFFGRAERAAAAQAANEVDWSVLLPDRGEGSANQAIRALLDDARRAMDERRQQELERSLNSVEELVEHAMDEIEGAGMRWGAPGSQAEWPPLWELGRNLYSFREEVIRAGNREYIDEMLNLDYWMVNTGLKRSCGELFTAGLNGYRSNYQIVMRIGSRDFQGELRDRFLANLDMLTFNHEPEKLLPFMQEVVRHQGKVLSDALDANGAEDFGWLHREFNSILANILECWNSDVGFRGRESEWAALLTQEYRIMLMGLVGRAAILAESGALSDAGPYIDVARAMYARPTDLSDDITAALEYERGSGVSQWHDWERPDHLGPWVGPVSPDRYPLTCFAVLLMDLAEDATLSLNLHGHARYVLDSFLANSERLERFVTETPSASARQRREFASEALRQAVLRDEIESKNEIIRRGLSVDRVGAFKSEVHEGMLAAGSVQRLFDEASMSVRLGADAVDAPEERGFRRLDPKAAFIDYADGDHTYYAAMSGEDLGRGLSRDAVHLLCEELEGAPLMAAPLDTVEEVFRAIDAAVESLEPQAGVAVVLAGDAEDIFRYPRAEQIEGYESFMRLTGADPLVDIGRYRGIPMLRGTTDGERRVYVVDLGAWGSYVRAPSEDGQDPRVSIEPISAERARELFEANPGYFSDQPDDESKMREMQSRVEMVAGVRHGFRVIDPTRARKINGVQSLNETDD